MSFHVGRVYGSFAWMRAKTRASRAASTRHWRDVLAEYRTNMGREVRVTLPRVTILEKPEEESERAA